MPAQKTHYKRLVERIQNHPVAAIILILTVGLIALAQLTGAIEKLWSTINPEPEIWEASKVRFKYYTLGGHSISLLLLGELDEPLTKVLDATPLISKNAVYSFLLNIQNEFAYPRLGYASGEFGKEIEQSKFATLRLCPGTYYRVAFRANKSYENPNSLLDDGWSIVLKRTPYIGDNSRSFISNLEEGKIVHYQMEFLKFLSRDEARTFFQGHREWPYLEWLTRENCPQDFFLVRAYIDECSSPTTLYVKLVPYFLRLRVLVIENISKSPVKLSQLSVSLDDNNILRPEIETQRNTIIEQILADDIMLPDECLVVPLELFLTDKPDSRSSWDELEFHHPLDIPLNKIDDLLHQRILNNQSSIRIIDSLEEREGEDATVCTISAEQLRKCLAGNQEFKRGDYYIGPSYSPQTIYVNDRKTSIRPISTASLHITHSLDVGSCPYVFVRLEDGSVKYCGKLLTGRSAQSKRGWYFKDLPLQTTSVFIKEEDFETTYLDSVRITISSNNSVHTILPTDSALHEIDGDIRAIEHGETLYLEFPNLGKTPAEAIRFNAFGYYVPVKSLSTEGLTFHNE